MREFERCLESEIPALRRYARALSQDSARSEDLLQDCLERAWSRQHLFLRASNLRAWLFRIMRNLHFNNLRSLHRSPVVAEIANGEESVAIPAVQISHIQLTETLAAFDKLPVEQREILLLVTVEGYTYRETARILGVPAGTVMSRMARAREHLRMLAKDGPNSQLRRVK